MKVPVWGDFVSLTPEQNPLHKNICIDVILLNLTE